MIAAEINLIGRRCQVIAAVAGGLQKGNHSLAALAEFQKRSTELFQTGHTGGAAVRTQENVLDGRIRRSSLNGLDGIP